MTDISTLAEELYANARAKGFYDHEDMLRGMLEVTSSDNKSWKTILAEHFGNRLMLIAGEAIEAHEEVRSGHGVAELYFSDKDGNVGGHPVNTLTGEPYKPEGVLAELADIAIRTLETMASILELASDEEKAKLRAQVPQNEASVVVVDANHNRSRTAELEDVNVGEVILLKHEYNLSRSHMNGGRTF